MAYDGKMHACLFFLLSWLHPHSDGGNNYNVKIDGSNWFLDLEIEITGLRAGLWLFGLPKQMPLCVDDDSSSSTDSVNHEK